MEAVACQCAAQGRLTELLRDLTLTIDTGQRVQIVGPSGSGKSTLLRLLNRLTEVTTGELHVLGRSVRDWPVRTLRRAVGMVFQEPVLLGRSVEANLRLPFELHGRVPEDFESRVQAVLAAAGVSEDWRDREEHELSFGQRQRVTLARTLLTEPRLLLLDEATAGLDAQTANALLDRIDDIQTRRMDTDQPLTVLTVNHRLDEVRRFGGRMVVLIDGAIAADGPVDALLDNPPTEQVADFLAGREAG